MRRTKLFTTTLALLLGVAAHAVAGESYVRFEKNNENDAALQCAVSHLRAPNSDVEIILYGVVHIADADYYARVQQDLDSYDVVLYEGVAPGSTAPTEEDKTLGELQKAMGELLGLTFQKDGIDYTRQNLVHADMNMDQLKEALGGGSINPMGQMMDAEQMKQMAPMMKMAASFGKVLMENNPQMRNRLKMQMGGQLGNADGDQLAKGLGENAAKAILIDRNKVVMDVLARQLETTKSGTVAIFYGAAHMPDFVERLAEQGYTVTSKRWMTAWKVGDGVGPDEAPAPTQPRASQPAPAQPAEGPRWF
jgi:hypothetical protein